MALYKTISRLPSTIFNSSKSPNRGLFYWLVVIFNRYDEKRVQEIGPDRACAEWLIKNGASVRWKGLPDYTNDYSKLFAGGRENYIEAVDATESGINYIGFKYFDGCKYINEMKFVTCKYIDDNAIKPLSTIKNSLTKLEIVDCKAVTQQGLYDLKVLLNLKTLKIAKLPYVEDPQTVIKELKKSLPDCKVEYE